MTIATTRRLIIEVLEGCPLDARARSLLQKALAESWQAAPIRSRENAPLGDANDDHMVASQSLGRRLTR
jgi:hypothetical protein